MNSRRLRAAVWLAASGLATPALGRSDAADGETWTFAPFGTVHVYEPAAPPRGVVLFVSGDGGWTLGVIPMARRLQAEGALVVGIDIRSFQAGLERSGSCAYPAGSLEELSRSVQLRHHLPEYRAPVLVGYSSGATLVYAALAQAPPETFAGAISLGFCSDIALRKPLCRGRGLASKPLSKNPGWDLAPFADLRVPWTVLQGQIDQVCAPEATARFVEKTGSGRLVPLPKVGHGFSVTARWEPQYVDAYRKLASEARPAAPSRAGAAVDDDLGRLGLATVPADDPAAGGSADLMAVLLTGDGGWAEIDKEVAAGLAAEGVPVVGWSSLKYYWTPRTPEEAARDLAQVIEHYGRLWEKRRVLLMGYSFGADVLPFLVNRLPADLRQRVALVALLGLSEHASFEFHVTDWLGLDPGRHATVPEVGRLNPTPALCLRGEDESDSACAAARSPHLRVVTLPGGHHFGGDYARIARTVLAAAAGAR